MAIQLARQEPRDLTEHPTGLVVGGRGSLSGKLPTQEGQLGAGGFDFVQFHITDAATQPRGCSGNPWPDMRAALDRSSTDKGPALRQTTVGKWSPQSASLLCPSPTRDSSRTHP